MQRRPLPSAARWAPGSFAAHLSRETQAELLALGVPRRFEVGRRLLREGDASSHVELLVRGFVKITATVEGLETLLAIRVPGDLLGETGAISGRPRMATVTACGAVVSYAVTRADFRAFLRRHPDAAMHMTAVMGERLRWANLRRADFAAYPAEVRLARILLEIARACGQPTGAGVTIGIHLSQPELATMIGVAEATAQKAIRDLRNRGVIITGYRRVTITDLDALQAEAEADEWRPAGEP
jgi:CRP/FNR family transcriptional regulator, cyclic AMP receptor protein